MKKTPVLLEKIDAPPQKKVKIKDSFWCSNNLNNNTVCVCAPTYYLVV